MRISFQEILLSWPYDLARAVLACRARVMPGFVAPAGPLARGTGIASARKRRWVAPDRMSPKRALHLAEGRARTSARVWTKLLLRAVLGPVSAGTHGRGRCRQDRPCPLSFTSCARGTASSSPKGGEGDWWWSRRSSYLPTAGCSTTVHAPLSWHGIAGLPEPQRLRCAFGTAFGCSQTPEEPPIVSLVGLAGAWLFADGGGGGPDTGLTPSLRVDEYAMGWIPLPAQALTFRRPASRCGGVRQM